MSSSKVLWNRTVVGKTLEKIHSAKILDENGEVFLLSKPFGTIQAPDYNVYLHDSGLSC